MRVSESVQVDNYTFPSVLRACANLLANEKGREVHGMVIRIRYDWDKFVRSSLLNFYTVFGEINDAQRVFDESEIKDVVLRNTIIMGYARAGRYLEAFEIFEEMIGLRGIRPNEGAILGLILACLVSKEIKLGKEIHGHVVKEMGFTIYVKLGAALIDFYAKYGQLDDARKLFEGMPERNIVVWNSMISGYLTKRISTPGN
ncbi:pentatricopeptide repeat-containing protein At2g02980, chloroplastic-like [Telopea speciosissima]|uniref:pentatricopeptide repeat-containing protein At2g02980, chloroplastic-like n=1 Tax=Telopea speciosissima TaxID=54955 RepID=UPI001CC4E944|nr:pentatricopeptide repeat-containing protein At2g02980, chloroplastic-like [Telopea speciosissima]